MPVASNCKIGDNVIIHNEELVNLYGCEIGSNTQIGPFVEIQKNVLLVPIVKFHHTHLSVSVSIHNNVFIGHGVFVNDKFPKSINPDGSMKKDNDWNLEKFLSKKEFL